MEVSTLKPARAGVLAAVLAVLCAASPLVAHAQQAAEAATESAAPSANAQPLKPNPEFANLPRYVGMLGKRQIVMRLGAKHDDADDTTGVHGEYQFTDTGEVVLIAGDHAGTTLEAEESNDGTHITGNWVGTFASDGSISGERMEVDDSNPVDFDLKPLTAGQPLPAAQASTPAAAAHNATPQNATPHNATPHNATADGKQPVNGISNLTTGE